MALLTAAIIAFAVPLFAFASVNIEKEQEFDIQNVLRSGRWISGFNGFVSMGEDEFSSVGNIVRIKEQSHTLLIRNGYLIADNLVLGLQFELSLAERKEYNIQGDELYNNADAQYLLGLGVRYYMPISQRTVVYPEFIVGHIAVDNILQNDGIANTSKASGIGARVGIGIGYFLNENISTDIQISFTKARLSGNVDNGISASLELLQPEITLGVSIFLEEFFF